MYAHIYLDVLQALLEAGDFPPAILQIAATEILNLFEQGNGLELVLESSNIDTLSIQKKARLSRHPPEGDGKSRNSARHSRSANILPQQTQFSLRKLSH